MATGDTLLSVGRRTHRGRNGKAPRRETPASSHVNFPPTLMTVRQIATHLSVSRATIRRMYKSGQIPYMRVGNQYRFDPVAVRAALDRHS